MNRKIADLINGYLDDVLAADEQCQLDAWIENDADHARQFAEAVLLHDRLRIQMAVPTLSAVEAKDDQQKTTTRSPEATLRGRKMRVYAVVASVAACLLIALGIANWLREHDKTVAEKSGDDNSFATIVQVADGRWDDGKSLSAGDRLSRQTLRLQSGIVHLQFDDGVEVTLQGPAQYELIAAGKTKLIAGLLMATVPPGAEGFQVDTPTAQVVDLGTAFGIELDDDGFAEVSVFDGEVEVTPASNSDKRLVHEGEAIRIAHSSNIENSDFDAAPFEKVWPISSGIVGSTGAFRFAPPWPRRLNLVQSDSEIFVLPEGYAQTLAEPIGVNVTLPGEYRVEAELTAGVLPAGTRVKSFLLQFKPVDQRDGEPSPPVDQLDPGDIRRIVGDITFDRPVLGLIVRGDDLRASDGRFSERGGQVPQRGRALELFGTPRDDVITLSEDRRTVKLDLAAFGLFSDHVRVIVAQSHMK